MERRTLLFCTSYADDQSEWTNRYWRWLGHIQSSGLRFDNLIIVDDSSPILPEWSNVPIYPVGAVPVAPAHYSIHRFDKRLGQNREGVEPFPGWYRSFCYALRYAAAEGFDRVIHIESDAFLLSGRAIDYFNRCNQGWATLWCNLHRWPESALQIINADQLDVAIEFFSRPYSEHRRAIEKDLPVTIINHDLIGDRYGETVTEVPYNADYVSQVRWDQGDGYFWWSGKSNSYLLPGGSDVGTMMEALIDQYATPTERTSHDGVEYRQFLSFLNRNLLPQGYLEIGTHQGDSLAQFGCNSVCIDPHFVFPGQVVGAKERLFLFQMTSDQFFEECDPKRYLDAVDIGFLDGLHEYEALLRDFINFERHAHIRSIAILHDCFPLNARMTGRVHTPGPESESETTRHFWTGDVWKVVPILRALRPDLHILGVDCPPTGLLMIRGLDPESRILEHAYESTTQIWASTDLDSYGLRALWNSVPVLDSHKIIANPRVFCRFFHLRE
jgi:hypothetical protein